jgi:signal transduction histidine kinase
MATGLDTQALQKLQSSARQLVADSKAQVSPFPTRQLALGMILTALLVAVGGVGMWKLYGESRELATTELRLRYLTGQILLFDEVLTMSARMAAVTGDQRWDARYREVEPQLTAALEEALTLAPDVYAGEGTVQTSEANDRLVRMEVDALAAVRRGDRAQAASILFSDDYEQNKRVYSEGTARTVAMVDGRIQERLEIQSRAGKLMLAIGLAVAVLLLLTWARIAKLIRGYIAIQDQATDALALANSELEARVKDRTSLLEDANQQLRREMRDREAAELELQQAQKLEAVGRLAAGIAHEINTPVQFVSDSVQFLREAFSDMNEVLAAHRSANQSILDGTPSPAEAEAARQAEEAADVDYLVENLPKALDRAQDGLGRVATIVRSMKEFAHPDRKEKTSVDLNRSIESTLVIAANEYKYVADLETEFGDLPPVLCHAGEINQVVLNIVVNAAHAIGDSVGRSGERGTLRVSTAREGEFAVIAVQDDGGGIPEEARDKIFEPFFTTKEVGRGTGQGLAIARSVVNKHGGTLTFDSTVGKGTTFHIRLPIQP